MSYRLEKNGDEQDLVIDGWEQGVAPSPHKGIANIQNGNISTETGEITASFSRTKQSQTIITNGTLTTTGSSGSTYTSSSPLQAGQWINVSAVSGVTYVPSSSSVSYLVAGAAGAGGGVGTNGSDAAGGGAAGEVRSDTATVAVTSYAVTIGVGGTGVSGLKGNDGGSSSFASFKTSAGGPGGAPDGTNGTNGGSGSGAGGTNASTTGGTATGNGNAGGNASNTGGHRAGGGGGGAGSAGSANSGTTGGAGGNGTASSISGASVPYGAGGGAGGTTGGAGGTGGGGAGGSSGGGGTAGTANTGSGGGGASGSGSALAGANGGSGVVIIAYATGLMTATGGTITTSGGNTIHTFTSTGTFQITAFGSVALPTGAYYVDSNDGTNIKLSFYFDPTAASAIAYTHAGTLTFSTTPNMSSPVAQATEKYNDGTAVQYRYYVLDAAGRVWVYDTGLYASSLAATGVGTTWFLPDTSTSYFTGTAPSGIGVLNGWLFSFPGSNIFSKSTVNLGSTTSNTTTWTQVPSPVLLMSNKGSTNPHYVLVGHQGRLYYTDGNYIGSFFPDTSLLTGANNVQSYCSYTATAATGTLAAVLSGSVPFISATARVPAVFFPGAGGVQPTNLTAATIYWIGDYAFDGTFNVYAASSGGASINIQTGASGTQYFNTFYPLGADANAGGTHATCTFSNQRVNLPAFEIAQCLVEVNNTVLIGCTSSTVYPWDQQAALPTGIINLPESNVTTMITVNQMAYIFAGTNGNIYITDGSTASLVLNVPDYCAGVPGSPGTYIEPNYYWGGAMYLRGRVYFSVRDQVTGKAGNCGGVWSFVPTQNLYIGQDTGIALRLEAQNSYGNYNGVCPLLIPSQIQDMPVPLYWSPWYSSITSATYGIDYSNGGTLATSVAVAETDLIPVGTILNKKTFKQVEYKLSAPLDVGATVTAQYRVNGTDAWTACDTFITDTDLLSGYVKVNFEKLQWLQLRFTLTPVTSSASTNTFIRFRQVRVR